jgi:hypothetical protein
MHLQCVPCSVCPAIFMAMHGPSGLTCSTLMSSSSETPQTRLLSQYPLHCCSPHVPCLFGASELVGDYQAPRLHVPLPRQLSAHAAATSLADIDDEVPIPRLSHHYALSFIDKGR